MLAYLICKRIKSFRYDIFVNASIPLPVERALLRLGQNIALARRRRQWTQQMLAERIGASVSTVRRMEEGGSGTAVEHIARALYAFGELKALTEVLDTSNDEVGMALMDDKLPKRVRPPKTPSGQADQGG